MKKCLLGVKKGINIIGRSIQKMLKCLSQLIKKCLVFFKYFFSGSMEKGMENVCQKRWYISAILIVTNFVIGFLILYCNRGLTFFFPHLVCLTLNIAITIYIGQKYVETLADLEREIVESHTIENAELRTLFQRFRKYAMCRSNKWACVIVLVIFFWGIVSQHYIKADVIGVYAIFIVTITVSISVIGYMQYLWMLWFLYRVSKCSRLYFNKNSPAHTPFLIKTAGLMGKAKWCFFTEGFLYVLQYYLLIPKERITGTGLQMPDNTSFVITWIVLFVVIILAFPALVLIQESLISKIVNDLKNKSLQILSKDFDIADESRTAHKYMYSVMIKNILSSADYPVNNKRFGAGLISLATFCLHITTFLTQVSTLNNLFSQ